MLGRLLLAALAALICLALPAAASAATIPVTTNADSGANSLRAAITSANTTAERDFIVFDIGLGGATTITLASALPAITQPVVLDGASQDVGIAQPVTIAGATQAGLAVTGAGGASAADGTQIFGFRLTGFTGNAVTVAGSYALLQDSVVDGNTGAGVAFGAGGLGAVGGASGHGNRISGNGGAAVDVGAGAGAVNVSHNTIGVNAAGTGAQANAIGVKVDATGASVFDNLISGNTTLGVQLNQCAVLVRNKIGLTAANAALPNGDGVEVTASGCVIGSSSAGDGNIVSANAGDNLLVGGDGATVQGNTFEDAGSGAGIVVDSASDVTIGGPGAAANTIAGNAGDGVTLTDAPDSTVNGNSITGNGGVGIHGTGTTTVEALTNSIAGNGGLGIDVAGSAPALASVAAGAGKLRARGSFTAAAPDLYTIELFANDACDGSGSGEGQTPLGTTALIVASAGTAQFNVQIDAAAANPKFITVTVTHQRDSQPGVTTKFSNCVQIAAAAETAFATGAATVGESSGQATIHVIRSGNVSAGSTVDFATSNGTATAGQDYTATSGTLSFAAGESDKTFSVPIVNDTVAEGLQTFTITLSNPSGSALGSPSTMTVTITSNDESGLVVNSAADTSDGTCNAASCTLREAILASNTSLAGRDAITFAEGVGTIHLTADLPGITEPVLIIGPATIDGGGHAVLRVLPSAGGTDSNDDTEVFGGVEITGTSGPAIDVDGARFVLQDAVIDAPAGIHYRGDASGAVGGSAGHGNTITAHLGDGVLAEPLTDVNVSHNTIDASAGGNGVHVGSAATQVFDNTVEGGAAGAGIALSACADVVTGNTVGGAGTGIAVNASGCQVGGSAAGNGNLVTGAAGSGITIGQGNADVIGNTIRENGADGVRINAGTGTRVLANTIRENHARGIAIAGTAAALVRGNSITANDGLGIDVAPDGVTAGAPVLSAVKRENGKLHVTGTLPAPVAGVYELEFSTDGACDPSGFGEGAMPIIVVAVAAAAAGNAALDFIMDADVPAGTSITATATRAGATTEFSGCVAVTEGTGGGTTPPPGGGGSTPQADPQSTITSPRGRVKRRRFKRIKGTAEDATRVDIAAIRVKDGKCYALRRNGRFRTTPGRCTPRRFFKATGTTNWSFQLKRRFPRGRFRLYSRATAANGTVEAPPARVRIRVRR